jgi:hypothetical protein
MLATLIGFAISWYVGLTPLFAICAGLSFFFPRLFRFLFWLFTFPAILVLDASAFTLICAAYDLAPLSINTFHASLYASIIPAFLITNYLAGDVR